MFRTSTFGVLKLFVKVLKDKHLVLWINLYNYFTVLACGLELAVFLLSTQASSKCIIFMPAIFLRKNVQSSCCLCARVSQIIFPETFRIFSFLL